MARVLVTGGAGFIGSNLVRALIQRGDRVVVLDDLSTGRLENLDGVLEQVELHQASLVDPAAVRRALTGVDGVLHQGALPSVPKSVAHPIRTHRVNVVGTLNLLEAARQAGVRRVVYAASSSAYGDQAAEVKRETLVPHPLSPYAVQKLTGEYYCRVYRRLFGVRAIGLRYFNVYGPRQNPKSQYAAVVPAFVTRMLGGQRPVIYGDGGQSRDFTFVRDVVGANLAALEAPEAAAGRIFNTARGGRVTLLELVDRINVLLGTRLEPIHEPSRPGDVRHSRAGCEAAHEALGWRARFSIEAGLEETVRWYAGQAGVSTMSSSTP